MNDREKQNQARDHGAEDDDVKRQRVHTEDASQSPKEKVLAPWPDVAMRLRGKKELRRKSHRVRTESEVQPSEVVLIEPGVQSAPIERDQKECSESGDCQHL